MTTTDKDPLEITETYQKIVKAFPYEHNIAIRFKPIYDKALDQLKSGDPQDLAIPVKNTGMAMITLRSRINDGLRFLARYADDLPAEQRSQYKCNDYALLRKSVRFRPLLEKLLITFKSQKSELYGTQLIAKVNRAEWKTKLIDFIESKETILTLSDLSLTAADQEYIHQLLDNSPMQCSVSQTTLLVTKE